MTSKPFEPLNTTKYNDIMKTDFTELYQPVENLITAGLTVFYGGAKRGKSWLAENMALSVARGVGFIGYKTNQCPVLYLALEDSQRRLKERNTKLLDGREESIDALEYATVAPLWDDGLETQLDDWLTRHGGRALVIIDVMQKILGTARRQENAYHADYRMLAPIKALADKHGAAIVLLHHTNKRGEINGSNGIGGTADTLIQLKRDAGAMVATLDISGRDVPGDTVTIVSDDGIHWERQTDGGKPDERRRRYDDSPIVQAIKRLVEENPDGGKISYKDLHGRCVSYFPYLDNKALAADFSRWIISDLSAYDNITVSAGVQVYSKDGKHEKGIEYYKKAC